MSHRSRKIKEIKKKNYVFLVSMVVLMLILAGIGIYSVLKINDQRPESTLSTAIKPKSLLDGRVIKDVDFKITKFGFKSDKVTVNQGEEYNFRFSKDSNAECSRIKNLQLGYIFDVFDKEAEYPIVFPQGQYDFQCLDSKSSFKVTAM